jgi:hypothetical protein
VVLVVAIVGIVAVWRSVADNEDARSTVRSSVADHADDFPVEDDSPSPDAALVAVLVATEDIPACTDYEGWTDSMALVQREAASLPDGALRDTAVVSQRVLIRDVAAGDLIKAQLFGRLSKCTSPSG